MQYMPILIFVALIFPRFDTHIISMTYNQSNASMSDRETREFFSIQTAFDYNRFGLNDVDFPKSTEIGFWYILSSTFELGLQYDGTRIYSSSDGSLLHKANSGIVSAYYKFNSNDIHGFSYKIGAFYGEVSIDAVDLTINNYELKEKSTGYGLVLQKFIISNVFFSLHSSLDIHYIFNNHHLTYLVNKTLMPKDSQFLRFGSHVIFDFGMFQISPYMTWVDGSSFYGTSLSLKFKKI